MVLLHEDNMPLSEWKTAIVLAVLPNKLGQVHTVDVRTSTSQVYRRKTSKFVRLLQ